MSSTVTDRWLVVASRIERQERMFAPAHLKSRLQKLAAVFCFGFICAAAAVGFIFRNPDVDNHVKAVTAFVLIGSLVLCVFSTFLAVLAVFGAFLAERARRLEVESELCETMEQTGEVARLLLVANLREPDFRNHLCDAMGLSERPVVGKLNPRLVGREYFTRERVAKSVELLETI